MKERNKNKAANATFGDLTTYMRNGKRVMREAHNKSGLGIRTPEQARYRLRMFNAVQMWRVMGPTLKELYPLRDPTQTAYNVFMQLNMPLSVVYLTKREKFMQACVLFNAAISQGQLNPRIGLVWKQGVALSDIELGDLVIDTQTTVGQLSESILTHNNLSDESPRFRKGDTLRVMRAEQRRDETTGMPVVAYYTRDVTLLPGNSTRLCTLVEPRDMLLYQGRVAARVEEGNMLAYILLRRNASSGTLDVSSQTLVGRNPMLSQYNSEEAFQEALRSYGGSNHHNAAAPAENTPQFDPSQFTDDDFIIRDNIDFSQPEEINMNNI